VLRLRTSFLSGLLASVLLLSVLPSGAVGSPSDVAQLRAKLAQLNARAAKAGKLADAAFDDLDTTDDRIAKVQKSIKRDTHQLAVLRSRLSGRLVAQYRRSDLNVVSFLLGSTTFGDFVTRMAYYERVEKADAEVIAQTRATLSRLQAEKKQLSKEHAVRARNVRALRQRSSAVNAELRSVRGQYDAVRAQLAAAARSSAARMAANAIGPPGPNGMVFPVQGPNYYSDTWGAPRGGGTRRHKGTDIMAAKGTPAVAVLSGTISTQTGGNAGKWISLRADNGWVFWYMHMDSFVVRSGHVQAGQLIGYVGNTGNAAGGASHVHFEVHPHGGSAVDPYPYLRGM
jgi:murein DD-endopeptidase MepM/ murein hydrolase activator NlpD